MAIEQASYTVITKEGPFEIRRYEKLIVAISAETDLRGYSGFNEAFNYISGANSQRKKITMTSPVINDLSKEHFTTAFVMPKEYQIEDLPTPASQSLNIKEISERIVAAITFSGNISATKIEEKKIELLKWLSLKGYEEINSLELARYNPPFIPGFMKRNDLIIEIRESA